MATACAGLSGALCKTQPGCSPSCPTAFSLCGATCVDLKDDEQNCGACGFDCGYRGSCTQGSCECAAPAVSCLGSCVDIRSDDDHCGACGRACADGTTCEEGRCTDIDECALGLCKDGRECLNTGGSFTCGACPSGYAANSATTCADLNECATNNGGCDKRTSCSNTVGSFSCGACPSGFTGDGKTGCVDINECTTNNGGCDALTSCVNGPGTFMCTNCPSGYTGTGLTQCTDIDECKSSNGGCNVLTTCTNVPGSRTCGACPTGYSGTGATGCTDINECATNNGDCDALTKCTNTTGSRTCGACPTGYTGTGATACVDIDECTTKANACDAIATCSNNGGSYACACPDGYAGDGKVECIARLQTLQVSVGTLTPAFDPSTTSYTLALELTGDDPTFTATVPTGTSLTIAGVSTASGTASSSVRVATPATVSIKIEVNRPGKTPTAYTIQAIRGESLRHPFPSFSHKGFISGAGEDTLAVTDQSFNSTHELGMWRGAVYAYALEETGPRLVATIANSNDDYAYFGTKVRIDGQRMAISGRQTVFFYQQSGEAWLPAGEVARPSGSVETSFGWDFFLEGDLFVASHGGEACEVYRSVSGAWQWEAHIPYLPMALVGGRLIGRLLANDSVVIYDHDDATGWTLTQTITMTAGEWETFGSSVAFDGDALVIGVADVNASTFKAHAYERDGMQFVYRTAIATTTGTTPGYTSEVKMSKGVLALSYLNDSMGGYGLNPKVAGNPRNAEGATHFFSASHDWAEVAYLRAPLGASFEVFNNVFFAKDYVAAYGYLGTARATYVYPLRP